MSDYFYHLPVGDYYLKIDVDQYELQHRLEKWFQFVHTNADQELGKISIISTSDDFSAHPQTPITEWIDQTCHFFGRGCKGVIHSSDPAQLWINSSIDMVYIEVFIRVVTAIRIFNQGGLLVHAAGLERDRLGYLFTGHSGAGKTTICRVSTDCRILNDDMVLLTPDETGWLMSATPFWNPTQVPPGFGSVPLRMLLQLNQAKQHRIEHLPSSQAVADLFTHIPVISQSSLYTSTIMQRCNDIVNKSLVKELNFLPDSGFWELLI